MVTEQSPQFIPSAAYNSNGAISSLVRACCVRVAYHVTGFWELIRNTDNYTCLLPSQSWYRKQISADDTLKYFPVFFCFFLFFCFCFVFVFLLLLFLFNFFFQKTRFDIYLNQQGGKMSNPVFWKTNRKYIMKLSSAEIAHRVVKAKRPQYRE